MHRTERKKAYREFLASDFWKALSKAKREMVGRCEKCKRKEFLQAHHVVYRSDWYDTKLQYLKVLCRSCHRREHGIREFEFMLYRNDERFSLYLHRCSMLTRMITT